jgi:dipeptidyl aminopeptidase/acylaminoacyl peptidase
VTSLPTADAFDLAPDGLLVHTQVARSAQAVAMALSGGSGGRVVSSHPVTEGTAPVTAVAITGDGSRIAYSREAAGRPRIEVVPFDGGVPQAVVPGTGPQEDPSWSPDGTQLAFTTEDAGGPRVMVMPYPAGTPQPVGAVRPGQGYRGDMDIFWSADGARLGYQAGDQKRFVLVNTHDQSEQPVVVPDTLGTAYMGAALSPEGRQLVASTFRTWSTWGELWLNDASTKAWRHLREPFGESTPLLWTGDQRLFLANQRVLIGESGRTRLEVWEVRMPEGTPRMLAPLPDGCDYSAVSISADGRRAVCVLHADQTDLIIATGVISGAR